MLQWSWYFIKEGGTLPCCVLLSHPWASAGLAEPSSVMRENEFEMRYGLLVLKFSRTRNLPTILVQ